MTNVAKNLLFGGLAYITLLYLSKKQTGTSFNSIKAKVVDLDIDISGNIRITINIANPTSADIVIRSIVGDLFLNGRKIADVRTFGTYTIHSNNQLNIPVSAKSNMAILITQYLRLKTVKAQRFILAFTGSLNIDNSLIPFTMSYTIPNE
jgi:LEA14-like dessication related protein